MKGGSKLFIFAGVGLALVAILLFATNMNSNGNADEGKSQASTIVTVVQAKTDLPAHKILTIEDVVAVKVDSTSAPADSVSGIAEIVGKAYRVPLVTGQTIVRSEIEVPGLRNDIAAGKRAIALPVDNISAMSGLVQDGDFIDIIYHARINLVRQLATTWAWIPEDAIYEIKDPPIVPPSDIPEQIFPVAGNDGSVFEIQDDGGQLQPVAKIVLQDIRILRVVRPGEVFLGNGMLAEGDLTGTAPTNSAESFAQFVLEVNPEQAEMITFLQDSRHEYQVIVRGKDDHESVTTVGITFQILATDPDIALPWPKSIEAPSSETASNNVGAATEGDKARTAVAEGESTPQAEG